MVFPMQNTKQLTYEICFISFSSKNASIYIELHRELILSIFTWRVQGLQFEYYTDELYRETIT